MTESLPANTMVTHYRILSSLAAGGMGEVYLAEDNRLGRRVVLKLLPSELTKHEDRVRRFEQEARAASALNHPNIVTIYEIGEAEAGRFIVMELVEGRTLREVANDPAPLGSVVAWGEQVAKALSVAHAAGITHRDIKPENIMVRDDGYVKVLDFGLARLVAAGLDTEAETLPGGTLPGMLVGTVRYMSPEQARGTTVSAASDIFALGIVLYELVTGRHPFHSDSVLGVLHAITSERPAPLARLNPEIPAALDALILLMLEKDPRLRPPASEVATALSGLSVNPSGAAAARPTVLPRLRPTVGRERERAELHAGFASARAGRGLLLCLAGEPGMGKTTLIEDFLADLVANDEPCLVARGRCSERLAEAEAYLPLLEALDSLLQGQGSGSATRPMKQLAPTWYLQVAPLADENSSSLNALSEAKAVSLERLKRELSAFFQEVSRIQPLVLFLDDLHWADLSTIDLLAYLGGKLNEMRMLIVATYRPSDLLLAKHPFLQIKPDLQAHGICREISLEFLRREEIERYLALQFPEHRFPVEIAGLIHAKTEGNPLFMADLVRYLRDRGVIAEEQGRWTLAGSLPEIERELPESVRGMIERKIAQLEPEDRRLLVAASVEGNEFDSAVVAKALAADPADVEERLEALERIYAFVRLVDEREFPDRTLTLGYRFVHVLYQNALYASLRPTRRAQLSAAVAEALLGYYGKQSGEVATELAYLFEAARDFARAVTFFHLAARNAAQVFALREVVTLARRGLDLLKALPDTPERAREELNLQISLGYALMPIKGFGAAEVKETYLRGRELCQQLGDDNQLFQVQFGLSIVHVVRAEYEEARLQAERCLILAEQAQVTMLVVQAHWALALSEQYLGALGSACEHLARSLELYDPLQHSQVFLYGALLNRAHLARLRLYLGYSDQAQGMIAEALAIAEKTRNPVGLANTLSIAAFMEVLHREPRRVQERADALISCAREHGLPYYAATGTILRGWALVMQREPDGIALMREGLAACRATKTEQHRTSYLVLLADALGAAGQVEEGLAALNEAIEAVERTKEHFYEAELYRIQGELILKSRAPYSEAEASFHRAIEVARRQQAKSFELRATMGLSRLWQEQGKRAEGRALLTEVVGWFTEGFDSADLREARALLDELA